MRKLFTLILTLLSLSVFSEEKGCRVEIVFPYGTEVIDDVEVITTFDGPVESLSIDYIHSEMNKALAPLDAEVAGRGENSDYKIMVGFSGMLNKNGSSLKEAYLQVKNYDRSIESRKSASVLGMLKNRNKRAKKLFGKTLKALIPQLDKCYR